MYIKSSSKVLVLLDKMDEQIKKDKAISKNQKIVR